MPDPPKWLQFQILYRFKLKTEKNYSNCTPLSLALNFVPSELFDFYSEPLTYASSPMSKFILFFNHWHRLLFSSFCT